MSGYWNKIKDMKKIFLIVVVTLFVACSDDEKGPKDGMGCMTGINKSGGTERVLIRCCTHQQFLAGSNEANGGKESVKYYKDIDWRQVDDCSECY